MHYILLLLSIAWVLLTLHDFGSRTCPILVMCVSRKWLTWIYHYLKSHHWFILRFTYFYKARWILGCLEWKLNLIIMEYGIVGSREYSSKDAYGWSDDYDCPFLLQNRQMCSISLLWVSQPVVKLIVQLWSSLIYSIIMPSAFCPIIMAGSLCSIIFSSALCPIIITSSCCLMMIPCALHSTMIPSILFTAIITITLSIWSTAVTI